MNLYNSETINENLQNLLKIYENPIILVVGRGRLNHSITFKSIFDSYDNKIVKTVDFNSKVDPDLQYNFDLETDRALLKNLINESNQNIILIQFDWSVLKFIKKLEELFNDVYNMLVPNGMLIFPFDVFGGCIYISDIAYKNECCNIMNQIIVPSTYLEMDKKNKEIFKMQILLESKNKIKKYLSEIGFITNLISNENYIFFEINEQLICDFYICVK
jgi:hypothetical protein